MEELREKKREEGVRDEEGGGEGMGGEVYGGGDGEGNADERESWGA